MDTLFNRIFVPSQLTQLLNTGTMNHAVLAAEKYNLKGNSLAQTLTNIYGYLKYNHRNEYFYKNELFNKIVLGRHSLKTTSAIRELPVGKAIADFIIINGKAQVYEIKTDLDNLDRVKAQITSYFKAFKYVNVITCDTKVKSLIRKIDEHVGIYTLTKRNQLHCVRKAEENVNSLDSETIFKILRKKEYEYIVKNKYGELPRINAFDYYSEMFNKFREIPLIEQHNELVYCLKQRYLQRFIGQENLISDTQPELRELVYFSNYTKKQIEHIQAILKGDV